MFKRLFLSLLILLPFFQASAQIDSSHLRISLVTCGPGDEIWETFGHTGVRVTDTLAHTDMVFNYGTFNGFEKDFELKFMRGKLLYYVSYYPFPEFMEEYVQAHRKVEEQVLQIDGKSKEEIYAFLKWNAEPQNREYKYDFLFDNCATRIRDIFPKTLGNGFQFGKTAAANKTISFRQIVNQYLYKEHFERLGINLLLGSKVDKKMDNAAIMFLPDFLRDGLAGATLDNKPVAEKTKLLLDGSAHEPARTNWAFITLLFVSLLTIVTMFTPALHGLGMFLGRFLLVITGLLGCLMLFMWFGTDHQACQDNFNVLWALPTNLIFAFTRNRSRYAGIAIVLLFVSLLLHVLHIQELPLGELWPLLLALLCTYGTIYKRSKPAI
ncbi:Lnb N-terminal periplasmic domain-containing protein [Taibaiella soli]|uniref:Uncharacterized protein n=1 Tax=Taibaiella soli TaxID=1649169 RepID=A0A2W2AKT8_9BACT|nr:DUF4105 domain-containing protein [Taibaiella soli]PZF74182.1 hypothetical protein DN068_03970 [Taibaiella soli]